MEARISLCLLVTMFPFFSSAGDSTNDWILKSIDMHAFSTPRREFSETSVRRMYVKSRGSDGEMIDAVNQFFWNTHHGIAVELGAIDGIKMSETFDLVPFGWNRLLIEANPIHKEALARRDHSFVVNAAVCNETRTLHYLDHGARSGIKEFMSASSLAVVPPSAMNNATAISCVPLSLVFSVANVSHVNFFILDTEGSELEILYSIDWGKVTFDIIVVETEAAHRPPDYVENVTRYLGARGYVPVGPVPGRNSWFRREDFVPSRRPTIRENCFNGALWASIWRNINKTSEASGSFRNCVPGQFIHGAGLQNRAMDNV